MSNKYLNKVEKLMVEWYSLDKDYPARGKVYDKKKVKITKQLEKLYRRNAKLFTDTWEYTLHKWEYLSGLGY